MGKSKNNHKENKNNTYRGSKGGNNQSKKPKWNNISNSPSKLNTMDDSHKHIFAAYLNLAQYNAFVHLNHIAKKMGITKRGDETKLSQHPVLKVLGKAKSKNDNEQIEPYKLADADYAMRQLFTEFPFLKVLVEWKRKTKLKQDDEKAILPKETALNKSDDNTAVLNNDEKLAENIVDTVMSKLSITAQPDMLLDILSNMFDVLNYHRNHHTHYKHSFEKLNDATVKNVALICNFALRSARRIVKTRFGVNPKDNPGNEAQKFLFLQSNDLDFIAKGQDKYDPQLKKSVVNPAFFYAMQNGDKLTSMGLVFLICMFLPRNYIMMFIDKLGESFYGIFWAKEPSADNPEKKKHRRIMREIFGSFNMPMIRERYRSEREDIALALDMINDLKKCPKLLYDHLSPIGQSNFKIGIDAKFNNNENSDDTAEITLIRHTDRFPYFALRYIDELEIFPYLRFHVNYGKYRFMLYNNKTCIDGSVQPRVLQYDLNGFGRLSEVEKIRSAEKSDWLGNNRMLAVSSSTDAEYDELPPDSPEILPYVTNCGTHYQFYGDKIGLRFLGLGDKNGNVVLDKDRSGVLMPPIDTLKDKAEQKTNNHSDKTKDENPIEVGVTPQCWLSTFDLPAMAFYARLTRDKKVQLKKGNDKIEASPTEKIIWDCLSNYKELFNQLGKNQLNHFTRENLPNEVCGIKWKDIPQKIRDYMLSNNIQETQEPQFDEEKFLDYAWNLLVGKKNIIGLVEQTQGVLTKFLDDFKSITGYEFSPSEYKFLKKDSTVKKNQAGRRSFTEIKPGRLSNYLARDIVALSSLSATEKPTGLNYNIIQKAIAQYGGTNGVTLDDLIRMFEQLGLIDTHPFLRRVLNANPNANANPANTLVLYYRYLICKINYLNELVQYVKERNVEELKNVSFLHSDQRRFHLKDKGYYAQLAEEYKKRPIQLPTGLFTDAIRDLLIEDENFKKIVPNAENKNAAWLIKQYHQTILKDGMQPMYGFSRNYKLYDTLWPQVDENGNPLKHYIKPNLRQIINQDKTFDSSLNDIRKNKLKKYTKKDIRAEFRRFDDHERLFRRYQVQDIVTFLMAKDILNADYPSRDTKNKEIAQNHEFKNIDKFKLNALCLKASQEAVNILECQVPFSVTLSIGGVKVEISEKMKIKNYGDFFRYVNDTRLVNLLPYLSKMKDNDGNIEIKRSMLEQELQAYDNNRVEIYKCVHDVEKAILDKFKELENKYYTINDDNSYEYHDSRPEGGNQVPNNFRAIINYFDKIILQQSTEVQLSNIMGEIRNAFSHNRYARYNILNEKDFNAQITQIANRIKNIMNNNKKEKIKNVNSK